MRFIRDETGLASKIGYQKDWRDLADRLATGELHLGVFEGFELAWAQERGDLFAVINFRTIPQCWCLLAQDKPDEVRREIKEAMASWSHSGVHVQHWYELLSLSYTEIYSGAGAAAYARSLSIEFLRCGQPDPAVAAGDKDILARQPTHCRHSFRLRADDQNL